MSPEQATGDRQLTRAPTCTRWPPQCTRCWSVSHLTWASRRRPLWRRFCRFTSVDRALPPLSRHRMSTPPSSGPSPRVPRTVSQLRESSPKRSRPGVSGPRLQPPGQRLPSDRSMRALQTALALSVALTISMAWALFHRRATAERRPFTSQCSCRQGSRSRWRQAIAYLVLSPDGSQLVFVGEERGVRRLYRRALGDRDVRAIPGTEGAAAPFFSPDGTGSASSMAVS